MSRSSKWRNRRREERQQEANVRAAQTVDLPCGCRSSLPMDAHFWLAHTPEPREVAAAIKVNS